VALTGLSKYLLHFGCDLVQENGSHKTSYPILCFQFYFMEWKQARLLCDALAAAISGSFDTLCLIEGESISFLVFLHLKLIDFLFLNKLILLASSHTYIIDIYLSLWHRK
jgi:hypothetical protein